MADCGKIVMFREIKAEMSKVGRNLTLALTRVVYLERYFSINTNEVTPLRYATGSLQ
jgi:hypothetical protein